MKKTIIISFLMFSFSTGYSATNRETPIVKVVKDNAPSVVNISTEQVVLLRTSPFFGGYGDELDMLFDSFFGRQRYHAMKTASVGSGVIIDTDGLIITNAHVVDRASNIIVKDYEGNTYEGEVVYKNYKIDLALVKIYPDKKIIPVKIGKTDDVMIGETVVAIGNPLGFENTVTSGIISGKNRDFFANGAEPFMSDLIQTDAPINPGNSGGALFNLDGELIGINTAVVEHSQNLGFAIPAEKVSEIKEVYTKNKGKLSSSTKKITRQSLSNSSITPNKQMDELTEEIRKMFDSAFGKFDITNIPGAKIKGFSALDYTLSEENGKYIYKFNIDGLDKAKTDVKVENGMISISGQYSAQEENNSGNSSFSSFSSSSFMKSFAIPADAKEDTVKIEYNEKELVLTFDKK